MNLSPTSVTGIPLHAEGPSSLLTQRNHPNSYEQKQSLEERKANALHLYPVHGDFSFSEVFGKEQCSKNYHMKELKPASGNKSAQVFVTYLQTTPDCEIAKKSETKKTAYKESKKRAILNASGAIWPSKEEKRMDEILHANLMPTGCFFAMDEHYDEVRNQLHEKSLIGNVTIIKTRVVKLT